MKTVPALFSGGVAAILFALTACGGGSGDQTAGIGGTGKIASGTITGFGSIFVNGGEYDIDAASCEIDDEDRSGDCQSGLRIGMVVSVASDDFSGSAGTATSVRFDDDVEGPVSGLIDDASSKRFSILGTTVVADAATTRFEGLSFDSLADGDVVEVSGFYDSNGTLHATWMEWRGSFQPGVTVVELKGSVSAVAAGAFTLNGVQVNVSASTDVSDLPGGSVAVGMLVEAQGVLNGAGEIDASRVEQEQESIDDADDISLEGLVSDFVDIGNFRVAGQAVDASAAVLEPASLLLADGLRVEVEGSLQGGVLLADEVEAEGGEIDVNAPVSGTPSGNQLTLALGSGPGSLLVTTDSKTEYEDETGAGVDSLADLADGDFVQVRAYDNGAGSLVASKVRRDFPDTIVLRGPVDSYIRDVSVTVLGVTFTVQSGGGNDTQYEDEDEAGITATAFFDALDSNPGRLIKIRDETDAGGNPAGVADEVDLED